MHTVAQERALEAHTRVVTSADAKAAAAAVAGAPQDAGQWGPVVDWPVIGVHVALLPNGKVLAYDSVGDNATESYPVQDHTRATVWDPATGSQTPVNVDRMLVAGGGSVDDRHNLTGQRGAATASGRATITVRPKR